MIAKDTFTYKYCPHMFKYVWARGGHQKVHMPPEPGVANKMKLQ
jgi:hypothetical protein